MKLGLALRNMGDLATASTLGRLARAAEEAGLDSIWVTDHVAIPPDDAAGSGGRYLDPLATLAYLAGRTSRIRLGTAVLILPYRPALPTAKWIATVQELSGERLELGVGVGWMEAEFKALGLNRRRRGAATDRVLELLNRCFDSDSVTENGQRFLFRPRPARPPIYIGGRPPHALQRAVAFGDGWLPVRVSPGELSAPAAELARLALAAGKPAPRITVLTTLPVEDVGAARGMLEAYRSASAQRVIHAGRYQTERECRDVIDHLAEIESPAVH